jgi:hypothetical protein
MARAVALARTHLSPLPALEMARVLIVSGCGLALLLAGQALPF